MSSQFECGLAKWIFLWQNWSESMNLGWATGISFQSSSSVQLWKYSEFNFICKQWHVSVEKLVISHIYVKVNDLYFLYKHIYVIGYLFFLILMTYSACDGQIFQETFTGRGLWVSQVVKLESLPILIEWMSAKCIAY